MGQPFTPIHRGTLGLQLYTPVTSLGQWNGFLQAMAGLHPANQNQKVPWLSLMNLKPFGSLFFLTRGALALISQADDTQRKLPLHSPAGRAVLPFLKPFLREHFFPFS